MLQRWIYSTLLLSILIPLQAQWGYQQSPRKKISLNASWKFHLGEPDAKYYEKNFDDQEWPQVQIPHTLELTSLNLNDFEDDKTQGSFQRKVGWYRRSIQIDQSERKVFLEFEGAHQVTDLWVNGRHVGQHVVGGYTPFHFDITAFVEKGKENQVTLLVDNRRRADVPPDPGPFDYIKFSGLYRDVYLVETNPVRLTFNWEALDAGITLTTPSVDPINGNATIDIKTVVKNETANSKEITVINRVIDANGFVVLKLQQTQSIGAQQQGIYRQISGIEKDAHLWSIDDPYLYRVNTLIYEKENVLDGLETNLGLRKFEQHPREGFLLNGKPIKLIGANRHQHFPYIGDALPNSLHYKDMLQFKALGFNVVRTAHYPQDNALIEACDKLGILVYEEAPTWINIGGEAWFDNLEKATRTMIRNHRNHPSVVIWGAGINHRGYVPRMHYAVKQEDPTRLTASQSSRWTGWQTSGLTDIYGQMIYGPVEWYRHEPMLAMEGREGIEQLARYKMDPLLTGIIAWTAHDYYTFHRGSWPERVRPGGILSIFRHAYGETPWYPIELKEEPHVLIATEWTEGTNEVIVYANTEEVELMLNGKTIGRQRNNHDGMMAALDHPPFRFPISNFQAGKLEAKGWTGSQLLASDQVQTPETPKRILLKIDTLGRSFTADGADILVAYAYVVDKNGTVLEDAKADISFSITGPASIVGEGTPIKANPKSLEEGQGMAPVLIRAGLEVGQITLTASAPGLSSDKASWDSLPYQADIMASQAKPFTDVETVAIDLGSSQQLLQYDWTAWNGKDGAKNQLELSDWGAAKITLNSSSTDGGMRWLGEMNVMGFNGYAIGEGVLEIGEDGLSLTLQNLPEGKYELVTMHHAPRSNTDSMDPNRERLKTLNILDVPYAKKLNLELVNGKQKHQQQLTITEGKMLPATGVAKCTFTFTATGNTPVQVQMKDQDGKRGVWLNAIVIRRLHS
ncbi:MAG: glycoside hydrolase family 2 protein [Saprospiraceae bacterium]|nr:glycoside hydrolase family 2 protein [Saprospiraceae bacterium]